MKTKTISPLATALGVLLIILSFAWPSLIDQDSVWSDEQEQERGDAIGELHRASHGASHGASSSEALELAQARIKRSNTALKQARDGHQWTIYLLKWSGIFLVAVGAIALIATRIAED
jgi:hypothetical protein